MRAVKERNKGRDVSGRWVGMIFMVYHSILRCGSGIIKFLGEIRPLGRLLVWEKLTCKNRSDWPEESEGPDGTGQRNGGWIYGSKQWIGSATIGSSGVNG